MRTHARGRTLADGYVSAVGVKEKEKGQECCLFGHSLCGHTKNYIFALLHLFPGSARGPPGISWSYMSGVDRRIANFASMPC